MFVTLIRQLRSRGLLYSAGIIFNRLVPERLMRARVFRVYELAAPAGKSDAAVQDSHFQTRWCESDLDFQSAESLTHYGADGDRVHSACLVSKDEEIVGAVWQAVDYFNEQELGIQYDLAPNQAWIFAALIAKEHRGRGAYRRLLRAALSPSDECLQSSLTYFASINPTNRASMLAHRSSIKRTVGLCIAIRIYAVVFCMTTGDLKSNRHASFRCDQAPIRINF